MGAVKITYEEWTNYVYVVQGLATRIGNPQVYQELTLLAGFYKREQTVSTRRGVLFLLCSIQTWEEYKILYRLQEPLVSIWIDKGKGDYMGLGPYTFFYVISLNHAQAMTLLHMVNQIYSLFPEHMVSIMIQFLKIGGIHMICGVTDWEKREMVKFLLRRMERFLTFAHNLWRYLKLTQKQFTMCFPTKGDMHCNGGNPYFVYAVTPPVVYKPRDMRIDICVNDALIGFNRILPGQLKLPVMNIVLYQDYTGTMEVAVSVDKMVKEATELYFQRLGVLLCFAKLFGIHDLHRENIMATQAGPVIIDLECAFNASIIEQKSFDGMSLYDVRDAFEKGQKDNCNFFVEGKIPSLKEKDIFDAILLGFTLAAEACKVHSGELIGLYEKLLQREFPMRLTPVATAEYYDEMFFGNKEECQNLSGTIQKFCSNIYECLQRVAKVKDFNLPLLGKVLHEDVFYGDIPLLRMLHQVQGRRSIYVDNQVFAVIDEVGASWVEAQCKAFGKQIGWLNTETAKGELRKVVAGKEK